MNVDHSDPGCSAGNQASSVTVSLGQRSYSIRISTGIVDRCGGEFNQVLSGRQLMVVTDENVADIAAPRVLVSLTEAGFRPALEVLPPGEGTKTLRFASRLYDRLVAEAADRQTAVVALGGGVIGDLAGFVAATYARGIPFIQVPTTLLAMVDASIGGKVAVDHPQAKNMIGAFHQPRLVLCDPALLESLPEREYRSGLAEVVKHAVIGDASLFDDLEEQTGAIGRREPAILARIVQRNCAIKARIVEKDEHETKGDRAKLNYGHTFAHAFETAGGYRGLTHGEAVAVGMLCAASLANRLGLCRSELVERQIDLWKRLGLPTELPVELTRRNLLEVMRRDKKAKGGMPTFILPRALGQVEAVANVDPALVRAVIAERV